MAQLESQILSAAAVLGTKNIVRGGDHEIKCLDDKGRETFKVVIISTEIKGPRGKSA